MRTIPAIILLALASMPAVAHAADRIEHGVRVQYGNQPEPDAVTPDSAGEVALDPGYGGSLLKERSYLGQPHGTAVSRRIMRLRLEREAAEAMDTTDTGN